MLRTILRIAPAAPLAWVVSGCSRSPIEAAPPVSSGAATASSPESTQPAFTRPTLVNHTGQYFRWMMPAEWKASETGNGVDLISADGKMIANSALLVGSMGQTDPWSFLDQVLTGVGCTNLQRISAQDLPSRPSGYPGINWQIQAFQVTFTDSDGQARQGEVTVGICNAYGGYSAMMQGSSSPPGDYDRAKTWLPMLAQSIQAIDPSKIAYQNNVLVPRNHPLDNSGLMESWRQKGISQDRIMQMQHETTMGYQRMVSPINGEHYNMPFESYDSTLGGYRDPAWPSQVLKHASPGE